ncbi:hypothetical protein UF64_05465 [Thalassospira sp. HJ]|uniref:FliH/SctL family protein n=1 Tax=Thalassospira sp. HJ TaxID=1616823 RepID=UPI0005CF8438|nr:FliH/SctL family protein [Thalassospira sp. HJ]KJE36298.1 hypothetical protein UF64_05465 [Thalassospira sp. HJ]
MTAIEKFTFSLSFDDADNVIRSAGDEDEHYELGRKKKKKKEEEAPPPPPPVYTEEEGAQMVAEAEKRGHEQGYAEGHKQGFDDAHQQIMASLEKAVGDVESEIAEKLSQIDEQQKRANAKINEDAIHVALGIIRKLAPAWSKQYQLTEIEDIVRQCLANLFEAPKVMIKVHPDLEKDVGAAAERIAVSRGFSGKVVVVGEPDVAMGDCQVSWGDGTAVRDSARVWSEINTIIDNALALHAGDHDLGESDMGDPEVQESRLPPEPAAPAATVAPQPTDTGNVNSAPKAPAQPEPQSSPEANAAPTRDAQVPHQPVSEAPTQPTTEQAASVAASHDNLAGLTQGNPADPVTQVTPDGATPQAAAPQAPGAQEGDGTNAQDMQTSQADTMSEPVNPGSIPQNPEMGAAAPRQPAPEATAQPGVTEQAATTAQGPAQPDETRSETEPHKQENPTTTADDMAAVKQPTKDAGDENG